MLPWQYNSPKTPTTQVPIGLKKTSFVTLMFLSNNENNSYLRSETQLNNCFFFFAEFYQVSSPTQWGPCEDLSCCRANNVSIANSCYPHSIRCAGLNDIYPRARACWGCPISHTEEGLMINY